MSNNLKNAYTRFLQTLRDTGKVYDETKEVLDSLKIEKKPDIAEKLKKHFFEKNSEKIEQMLQKRSISMMVLGELKSGKSTVLNTLLGGKYVFPVATSTCTARICKLKFSEKPYYRILSSDLKEVIEEKSFISGKDLEPVVNLPLEVRSNTVEISKVIEIGWNDENLLKWGVELIDSPGLSENKELSKSAVEFAKAATVIVYILDGSSDIRAQDIETIRIFSEFQDKICFVINKWDSITGNLYEEQGEKTIQEIKAEKAKNLFEKLKTKLPFLQTLQAFNDCNFFFPVSAKKATLKLQKKKDVSKSFRKFIDYIHKKACDELSSHVVEVSSTLSNAIRSFLNLYIRAEVDNLFLDSKYVIDKMDLIDKKLLQVKKSVEHEINESKSLLSDRISSLKKNPQLVEELMKRAERIVIEEYEGKSYHDSYFLPALKIIKPGTSNASSVQVVDEHRQYIKNELEVWLSENMKKEISQIIVDFDTAIAEVLNEFEREDPFTIFVIGELNLKKFSRIDSDLWKRLFLFIVLTYGTLLIGIIIAAVLERDRQFIVNSQFKRRIAQELLNQLNVKDTVAEIQKKLQILAENNYKAAKDRLEQVKELLLLRPYIQPFFQDLQVKLCALEAKAISIRTSHVHHNIQEIMKISGGAFGEVFLVLSNGKEYALKVIKNEISNSSKEVHVLSSLSECKSPFILPFEGCIMSDDTLKIFSKYMKDGDLYHCLKNGKIPNLNDRLLIALKIALGMEVIHKQSFMHRDLKALNVLMDLSDKECRIGDVGLANVSNIITLPAVPHGTPYTMAPEMLSPEKGYTSKVDVFSFGIILYELWTNGQDPYPQFKKVSELLNSVSMGARPKDIQGCDTDYESLMKRCWDEFPEKRPDFSVIVKELTQVCSKRNIHISN